MDYRVTLLVFFIASCYSYCDPITDVCRAAGLSCPDNSINTCTISGSSERVDLNHYDVVCYGFLYLTSGYIKGRAFMGHDFNPENNRIRQEVVIGQGLDSSDGNFKYSFLSASDVAWPEGNLYPLNARALYSGRNYGFPDNLRGRVDQCPSGSSCLNSCPSTSRRYYREISDLFASRSSTATATVSGGTMTISCSSSRSAYFITISGSSFSQVTGYSLSSSCNSNARYVFNINAGSSVTFSGTPFSGTGTVYNMRGSPTVNIKSDVRGTIINTGGDMKQTGGVLYGWLISGECHAMQKVGRPICAGSSSSGSESGSGSTSTSTSTSSSGTGTGTGTGTSTSTSTSGSTSTSTSTGGMESADVYCSRRSYPGSEAYYCNPNGNGGFVRCVRSGGSYYGQCGSGARCRCASGVECSKGNTQSPCT